MKALYSSGARPATVAGTSANGGGFNMGRDNKVRGVYGGVGNNGHIQKLMDLCNDH